MIGQGGQGAEEADKNQQGFLGKLREWGCSGIAPGNGSGAVPGYGSGVGCSAGPRAGCMCPCNGASRNRYVLHQAGGPIQGAM